MGGHTGFCTKPLGAKRNLQNCLDKGSDDEKTELSYIGFAGKVAKNSGGDQKRFEPISKYASSRLIFQKKLLWVGRRRHGSLGGT